MLAVMIIGAANSRKSSTIRALTGVGHENIWRITASNQTAHEPWYVSVVSDNENGPGAHGPKGLFLRIQTMSNQLAPGAPYKALFPLQIRLGQPNSALVYFQAFVANGANVTVVTLGQHAPAWAAQAGHPHSVIFAQGAGNNLIAADVRRHLGWL